jgi:hypothetical protein
MFESMISNLFLVPLWFKVISSNYEHVKQWKLNIRYQQWKNISWTIKLLEHLISPQVFSEICVVYFV